MTTPKIHEYRILYTPAGSTAEPAEFICEASTRTEAIAQCEAAHPNCTIIVARP